MVDIDTSGVLITVMEIVGPLLLGAALLYGIIRTRRTRGRRDPALQSSEERQGQIDAGMRPELAQIRSGTEKVMMGGVVAAGLLFIGAITWLVTQGPQIPVSATGEPERGRPTTETVTGRGKPAQHDAESAVAKRDPAMTDDGFGGKARAIKESNQPLNLTSSQRTAIREAVLADKPQRMERADFELMVGAAVPRQTTLRDIPPEVAEIMQGYWGNEYVLVEDKFIIVDRQSRRVAAIVSGIQ